MMEIYTYESVQNDPELYGRPVVITLDGKVVEDVFFADTDNGVLRKYKIGADGKPYLTEDRTEIATELLSGKVTLTFGDKF